MSTTTFKPGSFGARFELAMKDIRRAGVVARRNVSSCCRSCYETGVADDQPWLTVTTQSVDGSGLGSYVIGIDRTSLANGNYGGTVTFTTSAGTLDVPVNMIVDASIPEAAAGTLYQDGEPVAHEVGVPFMVRQFDWHHVRNDGPGDRLALVVDRDVPLSHPSGPLRLR
jgi:hypothetical protein